MTPAPKDHYHRPSAARSTKRLTRTAIVILSIIGLAFIVHGVYRVFQISDSQPTTLPAGSSPNIPSAQPTRETVPPSAEIRVTAPPEAPAPKTATAPGSSSGSASAPAPPTTDTVASPVSDGASEAESPAVGWSAEPLSVPGSRHPQSVSWDTEIRGFLTAWESAWENTAGPDNDMDRYMSFYASEFRARGMDKTAWRRDKQKKNRKKDWIAITLSDITIHERKHENTADVRFFQDYASSNYASAAPKTLILRRYDTGWKIIGIDE